MLPRNNADVTHCEKTVFYFQNKAVYRAENRLLPDKGKNLNFLISVFSGVTCIPTALILRMIGAHAQPRPQGLLLDDFQNGENRRG